MSTSNYVEIDLFDEKEGKWDNPTLEPIFNVPESYKPYKGELASLPFGYQSYALAAFIAGVRNYYLISPIAEGRGLPEDHLVEEDEGSDIVHGYFFDGSPKSRYSSEITENYSKTWVLLSELLEFNYDDTFEDRQDANSSKDSVPEGSGKVTTFREHLPEQFFDDLEQLKNLGKPENIRIVWAFD
ncbi:hypothetical protein [Vibrio crassostreae]|uniref:hypothetical protein n=1 Tax=Vibrio crassostreae TaxID=246167 RepID=UPI001B3130CA|nr:hypothetical protein [Vibrio crassostreae]